MKLRFLLLAPFLAAMGPGRNAPAPDPAEIAEPEAALAPPAAREPVRNPARLPPVSTQPAPAPPVTGPEAVAPPQVDAGAIVILDASEARPDQFLWSQRPIVVFADTPGDPAFTEQMGMLAQGAIALAQRDAVVVTDTDPAGNSVWRQQLRPRGFSLVILDKDGQVKQRKPSPWTAREIGRAIDRLPLRRQEIGRAGLLP